MLLFLTLVTIVLAAEASASEEVALLWVRGVAEHEAQLAAAQERLGSAIQRKSKEAAELRKRLEALKGEIFSFPRLDCFRLALGQIGILDYGDYVVDVTPSTFEVQQVLGPTEMLIRTGKKWTLVRGVSTAGIVDDTRVRLDQVVKVTGTHTYATAAGGSNTVFVVEPWDLTEFERWRPKLEEASRGKTKPKRAAMVWRKWTDATGQYSVEARLVQTIAGRVTLEKRDGGRVELAIEKLSQTDQEFLRDRKP